MAFVNATSNYPSRAAAVTPSDTASNQFMFLWCGGAGTLTVVTEGGDTVLLTGVTAGMYVWLRVNQVKATGTTATNIVGFN